MTRIIVSRLYRYLQDGQVEELLLQPGLNVITGPANTGKSTWIRMLDFLMGEPDSAHTKFNEVIVAKYRGVGIAFSNNQQFYTLERVWSDDGQKSKFSLNGEAINVDAVQDIFLEAANIPKLRYPQGNPLSDRQWPSLSWRSLLRHIYRRQNYWSDLVPGQLDTERHACILQFLGIAENLFSEELAKLADKRREAQRLLTKKEALDSTVSFLAPELGGGDEFAAGMTKDGLNDVLKKLSEDSRSLIQKRATVLSNLNKSRAHDNSRIELLRRRDKISEHIGVVARSVVSHQERLSDVVRYKESVQQEIDRLSRATTAASIFGAIRITHCPACDQKVADKIVSQSPGSCFLCEQHIPVDGKQSPDRRLAFEQSQLESDLKEADQLVQSISAEIDRLTAERRKFERELSDLHGMLAPIQAQFAGLVSDEVALLDQEIGALSERSRALGRLIDPMSARDELSIRIDDLTSEIDRLDAQVREKEANANFEVANDRMTDGIRGYLNALNKLVPGAWTIKGPVNFRVSERRSDFYINGSSALSKLGGTMRLYFFFAYHYALLNLSKYADAHYPGFVVLDLFADIADGKVIRDRLSAVMMPFLALSRDEAIAPIQIIVTASDFPDTDGVNKIQLTNVWSG